MKKMAFVAVILAMTLAWGEARAQESKDVARKEARKEKRQQREEIRTAAQDEVSEMSKNNFIARFGNIGGVEWLKTTQYDLATFTKAGIEQKAYFDQTGNLAGTTTVRAFGDLPEKAQSSIKNRYKEYTIGNVTAFSNNPDNRNPMVLWGVETPAGNGYFVELLKDRKRVIVAVDPKGQVTFFKQF